MKRKILIPMLLVSSIFLFSGCSIGEQKLQSVLKETEESFVYPDNSIVSGDDTENDTDKENTKDVSNSEDADKETSSTKLSYESKTVTTGKNKLDVPLDWTPVEMDGIKAFFFDDYNVNANLVTDSTQSLSPDTYMEISCATVKNILDVDDIVTDKKVVNGVTVYSFEYVQELDNIKCYTYQPTVFKDGTAYILTIGSPREGAIDQYKSLADEVITTVR